MATTAMDELALDAVAHVPTSDAIDAMPDNEAEGGDSNTPRNALDATLSAKPDAAQAADVAGAQQGVSVAIKLFTLPNPAWAAQDRQNQPQTTGQSPGGDGSATAMHPPGTQLSPPSSAGGHTPGSALRHAPSLQDEARLLEDVSTESLLQMQAHLHSLLHIVASAIASRQTARMIEYEDERAGGGQSATPPPAVAADGGADKRRGTVQVHSLLYLMPFQEQVRAAESFACRLAGESYCFSSGPELRKASRLCAVHDENAEHFVDHAVDELHALTEPDHVLENHDAFHRFVRDRKRAMTVQWRDRYLAAVRALIISLQAEPTRTMTRHGDTLLRLMDHEDFVLALLRMCRDRVVTTLPAIKPTVRLGRPALTPMREGEACGAATGDALRSAAAPVGDATRERTAAEAGTLEAEAEEEQATPHTTAPLDRVVEEHVTEAQVTTDGAPTKVETQVDDGQCVGGPRQEEGTIGSAVAEEVAATAERQTAAANVTVSPAADESATAVGATTPPQPSEPATAMEEPRRDSPLRAHPTQVAGAVAEEELSARQAAPQAYPQEGKASAAGSHGTTPLIAPLHPQSVQTYRPTSVEAAVQMHLTRLAADRHGRPRTYEKVLSRPSSPMPPDNAPRVHLLRGSSATRNSTGMRSSAAATSAPLAATAGPNNEEARKSATGLSGAISSAWQSRLAAAREAIARHPFLMLGHTPRESSLASTSNGSVGGGNDTEHASGLYAISANQPSLRALGPSRPAVTRRARSPAIAPSRSNAGPVSNGASASSKLAASHSFLERALAPRSMLRARSSSRMSTTSSVTGATEMPDSVVARRADSPVRKPLSGTYRAVV